MVVRVGSGTPVAEATVVAVRANWTATTDVSGRFTIAVAATDTLLVRAIGYAPMRVPVTAAALRIELEPVAVSIPEITTLGAPGGSATPTSWTIPASLIRDLPAAVEPDAFRALRLVPSVAFSSVLSARPMIRGYSADATAFRIDGFEVLNLYHIGRAFSAFSSDATNVVEVVPSLEEATQGGGLSGAVSISGRTGTSMGDQGGAALGPASFGAWMGAGTETRVFGSGRAAALKALELVNGESFPYNFQDGYGSFSLEKNGISKLRVSVFGSHDDLYDTDEGSGMNWGNVLVGATGQLMARGGSTLNASAYYSRFSETVEDVTARSSRVNVDNRFSRAYGSLDFTLDGNHGTLKVGGSIAARSIDNTVAPVAGRDFVPQSFASDRAELGAYVSWSGRLSGLDLGAGVRVDAAGSAVELQPRLSARVPLGSSLSLGTTAGRSARLYQLVSDPVAEPDLAFYDFWLDAGDDGAPTPVVDHLTADLTWSPTPRTVIRASVYGSKGSGQVELRPSTDQSVSSTTAPFRQGRSRTLGFEASLGWQDRDNNLGATVSYSLAWSERDWGAGWIPWLLDRRHMARATARWSPGRHIVLTGALEFMSGAPLTPVDQVILVGGSVPDSGGIGVPVVTQVRYMYGPEGALRSDPTFRIDIGAAYHFDGPWQSRWSIGGSITNATFGPVAIEAAVDPAELEQALLEGRPAQVEYERTWSSPAVPTLLVRVEF